MFSHFGFDKLMDMQLLCSILIHWCNEFFEVLIWLAVKIRKII